MGDGAPEELSREYQEALLLLGRLLFAQGRHAEAAEAYRKAIAHDELAGGRPTGS
jgi:tetratricopeptide (TPR) repeat protein